MIGSNYPFPAFGALRTPTFRRLRASRALIMDLDMQIFHAEMLYLASKLLSRLSEGFPANLEIVMDDEARTNTVARTSLGASSV